MKDYLVLGLMPFFPVRAYDVDRFNPDPDQRNRTIIRATEAETDCTRNAKQNESYPC